MNLSSNTLSIMEQVCSQITKTRKKKKHSAPDTPYLAKTHDMKPDN